MINYTQDDRDFKKQVTLINIPFLMLLGLITIVINGLLLWVIITDPLRTFRRPKILIDIWTTMSLFWEGTLLMPLIVTDEVLNGVYDKGYTALSTFVVLMMRLILGAGSCFLLVTVLEGTGGILKPHLVRRVTTKRNITSTFLIILGVTLLYSLLLIFGVPEKVHSVIFVHIYLILPLLIESAMFLRTYKRIRNPKKVVPTTNPSVYDKEKRKMNRLRNEKISKNFIKTIGLFFSPFLVSSLSYYLFVMMKTFSISGDTCESSRWCIIHERLMLSLLFINPACTPISLTYKIAEYRNAMSYNLRKTAAKICKR